MKIILPRFAIVIGTRPDREEQLNNCLASIGYTKYLVVVVDCDGYEIGKIKSVLKNTKIDKFIFLQDSVEVKDKSLFDLCFLSPSAVSLCNYPKDFGCYLGMYWRETLEKMNLPDIKTKLDAVNYEEKFADEYSKYAHSKIMTIGKDMHNVDNFVEKWGHKVMMIENDYLIKYKTCYNRDQL
jgi:hypothetical protein